MSTEGRALPDETLVSVVVPARNAQAFLGEALASVAAQRGPFELEIVVVDDGSNDATADIARAQPGVRCLSQPHRGPSAARNAGVAASRGGLIAFLDADDLWPAGKLDTQLTMLRRHPEAALVFGDCRQFDATGPHSDRLFDHSGFGPVAWGEPGVLPDAYARLLADNFITTGSVVVRRLVLERLGGFEASLRLVEDLDLWLRMAAQNPLVWCPQVCLLRRRHDANISRDAEAMVQAYLKVLTRQAVLQPHLAQAHARQMRRLRLGASMQLVQLALTRHRWLPAGRELARTLISHPGAAMHWLVNRLEFKLGLRDRPAADK